MKKLLLPIAALALLASIAGACGGDDSDLSAATAGPSRSTEAAGATATPNTEPSTLRLGYFANITHSQPLVGLSNGTFQEELGDSVTIKTKTFNAGPSAIEALFAGEIDATFIGPNPAVNGYIESGGEALRIVAGATSGGALFIVNRMPGSQNRRISPVRSSPRLSSETHRTSPFGRGWRQMTSMRTCSRSPTPTR